MTGKVGNTITEQTLETNWAKGMLPIRRNSRRNSRNTAPSGRIKRVAESNKVFSSFIQRVLAQQLLQSLLRVFDEIRINLQLQGI